MSIKSIHIIDYIIVISSLAIPLFVTLFFARGQKNLNTYFKAGGKIPAWAVGISIMATLVSSITFLAYPGEGYSSNWILLVQGLMVPITLIVFIKFLVPLYRNVIQLSAYEYFEHRFGFIARLYSSLGFFLAHFSKMGTVFFLVALAFSKMTGFDTVQMIWILGIIVIFITLIGGIEAVIWLDVVQGFLLVAGGIVALAIIIASTPGGLPAIWQVAEANGHTGFGPYDIDFVNLTFIVMAINGIFYAIQKYGTDQTIVQRYLTAKSDKQAVKASLIGVLSTVPVWALFMFLGTALFSYYAISGDTLPAGIRPDAVFPNFIITKLPVGVIGLILSALLAAAISSLTSDVNCLSAIFLKDYYVRIRPASSEKHQMLVSKITVIVAGIVSIFIATYYTKIGGEGALGFVFGLYAIFSGGIAGLFLLGIFVPGANKKGTYIGIAACVIFTSWAVLTSSTIGSGENKRLILDFGQLNFTHHKYMLGVYSHLVLFIVGYIASLFFRKTENIDHLTYKGWLLKKKEIKK